LVVEDTKPLTERQPSWWKNETRNLNVATY